MSSSTNSHVFPSNFTTCGMDISLTGRNLPETIKVTHPVPEASRRYAKLRREKRDCDVTVIARNDVTIQAHKVILCDGIPYFRALFEMNGTESIGGVIDLSASFIDDVTLLALIDDAYTGILSVSTTNVPLLMTAATYLQLDSIVVECARFIDCRIDALNALSILTFYRSFSYDERSVLRFIDANFLPISRTPSFLELSLNNLIEIIMRDTLNVDSEDQVFEAVSRWMQHDSGRMKHGPTLLKHIRTSLLSIALLDETSETSEKTARAALVQKAKEFIRNNEDPFKTAARNCEDAHRLVLAFDFYSTSGTDIQCYCPVSDTWKFFNNPNRVDDWARLTFSIGSTQLTFSIGAKIYFFTTPHHNDVYQVYDTATNAWERVGSNGYLDNCMAVQPILGKLFCAGGEDDWGHALSRFFVCPDPVAAPQIWKRLRNLSKPRLCAASAVLDGNFFVIGGMGAGGRNEIWQDSEVYDIKTDRWSPIAPMKTSRTVCHAAAFRGKIFVVGGNNGQSSGPQMQLCDDVESYDPSTDSWTTLAGMKIELRPTSMTASMISNLVVSCGRLLAIVDTSIIMYNEVTDEWETLTVLPKPLAREENRRFVCALDVPAIYGSPSMNLGNVSLVSCGFRHFALNPNLLKAISETKFEEPSEVQHDCLTQSMLGMDLMIYAKSGSGKTSGAVISTLHLLKPMHCTVSVLVVTHSRKSAAKMAEVFGQFAKYLPEIKIAIFCGADRARKNVHLLKKDPPHITIVTPARLQTLVDSGALDVNGVKMVVIDDCDEVIGDAGTRDFVKNMMTSMAHKPQLMLFSSDLSKKFRRVCKEFIRAH